MLRMPLYTIFSKPRVEKKSNTNQPAIIKNFTLQFLANLSCLFLLAHNFSLKTRVK